MLKITELPRPPRPQRGLDRRYVVEYDLAYDGGGGKWEGYYRTKLGARIGMFWNYHVASYGGSAVLWERSLTGR